MYNFSQFTIELNELEPDVAPTDSRLRPDQRLMENGFWDQANEEKRRLEQKQRTKRYRWEEEQASGEIHGTIDDVALVWNVLPPLICCISFVFCCW